MLKISSWLRRFSTVFLCLLMLASIAGVAIGAGPSRQERNLGSVEIMSTSEITEGMRGVAKTVVHGVEIEEFDVEILSVVPDLISSGDGILAKVSGDVIERTGGVVQGMSGSPVYIDGKLVGAISGAFRQNPDGLAVITPIEDMLAVLEQVDAETSSVSPEERWGYEKLKTPLLVSGLSSRAIDVLSRSTADWGLVPVQSGTGAAGGTAAAASEVQLVPGASVAMQWVRGDVNLTAVGTVTHLDDDQFVAFGHTAGSWGEINTFASTAYVNAIVRSSDLGYKLASPIQAVGKMTQDRSAGVGGVIGSMPAVVQYDVKVVDKDRKKVSEYDFEVVRSELFTNRFAASALLGVLDRGIDRIGAGTSRVLYRIYPKGMDPIVRDNVYYSSMDITAVSLGEVLDLTDRLIGNEFQVVELERVEVEVEIGSERKTAVVERVKPDRRTVSPGESIFIEVVLRPYRGKRETKILRLDIPEEAQPSTVHVTVRGGGVGYVSSQNTPYHQGAGSNQGDGEEPEETQLPTGAESLEKLIKDFTDRPRNHDLVAEFVPYLDPFPADEEAVTASVSNGWNEQQPNPVRSTLATQYCLLGELGFDLTIVDPQSSADEAEGSGKAQEEPESEEAEDAGNAGLDEASEGDGVSLSVETDEASVASPDSDKSEELAEAADPAEVGEGN